MYLFLRCVLIVALLLLMYVALMTLYLVPYVGLCIFILYFVSACRKTYCSSAHGTARWATAADIPHMLEGSGLILGYIAGRMSKLGGVRAILSFRVPSRQACMKFLAAFGRRPPKQLVRLTNAVHTAVFAPTGVGKGVSCVIPFVLTCPDSMVIYDVKGEIAKITAKVRRSMGHRVIIIDPYKMVTQEPDTLNPLEFIDKDSETALDDIRDLAEALVVRTGQEKEPLCRAR